MYMKGVFEFFLEFFIYVLEDGRYVLVENMWQQLEEQIWGVVLVGFCFIGYVQSVIYRLEDVVNKVWGDLSFVIVMEGIMFFGFMVF